MSGLHWRWYWAGGVLTGYGLHWAQAAAMPFRLVIVAGIALGFVPAALAVIDKRAHGKVGWTVCWRCGHDTSAGFDLLRIGGRNVAVHKRGDVTCVPTLHRPAKETP